MGDVVVYGVLESEIFSHNAGRILGGFGFIIYRGCKAKNYFGIRLYSYGAFM